MDREKTAKLIVDSRDWKSMIGLGDHPEPGEFVITGIQSGNIHGQGDRGWENYFGHVVQVRKKAGCFGSDIVLIRHPDGILVAHENQSFCRVDETVKKLILSLFDKDALPENEDYSEPYTLAGGSFPEIGKVIEPKGRQSGTNPDPFMITTEHGDGTKTVTAIID